MLGGAERIGGHEVVPLEEPPAELGNEEHHDREQEEEDGDPHQVLHRVVGVEGDAVPRVSVRTLVALDLDPVRIVRADLVQGEDMQDDDPEKGEGKRHHVQGEEPVQGRVGDYVVAADPERQRLPDPERNRPEQRDDHLGAPIGHLPPRKQVSHERLRHQDDVDEHAEQPDELAVALVGPVDERPEHVQVHGDEEE